MPFNQQRRVYSDPLLGTALRLPDPHLTPHGRLFHSRSPQSRHRSRSMWRFEASPRRAAPKGRNPSSPVQHRIQLLNYLKQPPTFVAHPFSGTRSPCGVHEEVARPRSTGRARGGSSPACSARYCVTQFPKVPSLIPSSRATWAIGRDASITRRTASSRNSVLNFRYFRAISMPGRSGGLEVGAAADLNPRWRSGVGCGDRPVPMVGVRWRVRGSAPGRVCHVTRRGRRVRGGRSWRAGRTRTC